MKCKDLFLSYLTACPDCQSVLFGHGGGNIVILYYTLGNIQTNTQYQYVKFSEDNSDRSHLITMLYYQYCLKHGIFVSTHGT